MAVVVPRAGRQRDDRPFFFGGGACHAVPAPRHNPSGMWLPTIAGRIGQF